MSELDPELDESLRRKLLSLGEQLEAPLDGAAELRILAQLQRAAQEKPTRSKVPRRAVALAVLAAAAAALLVWLGRTPNARVPTEVARPEQTCPWSDSSLGFVSGPRGLRELALGPAGRVVLAEGARASVSQADCEITLELSAGALAAELNNLRPGSLRVRTELGDVRVRGTTFSVDLEQGLQVVLLEGRVELSSQGEPTLALSPGKTLRRRARRAQAVIEDSTSRDSQAVTSLLKESAPTPAMQPVLPKAPAAQPETSRAPRARPSDLLGQAEAARRSGDKESARAFYAQAQRGSHRDAEVALLRHAGFELEQSDAAGALSLLAEHARRFPRSRLSAEAAWLDVRARDATGDHAAARASAQDLVRRFPATPQARAAQRLLDLP